MGERKPLPKKLRYEVLKRDSFTCQYCGRMAPEVILEIDHIVPVAEGGKNEIFNLITSCRDCNRGKGKTRLDDSTALNKQKEYLKEANEKREQVEMMLQWKQELQNLKDKEVDSLCSLWEKLTSGESSLNEHGRNSLRVLIKRFSFQEVYDAMEVSVLKYYHTDNMDCEYTFDKIGGICWNRRNQKDWGQ